MKKLELSLAITLLVTGLSIYVLVILIMVFPTVIEMFRSGFDFYSSFAVGISLVLGIVYLGRPILIIWGLTVMGLIESAKEIEE